MDSNPFAHDDVGGSMAFADPSVESAERYVSRPVEQGDGSYGSVPLEDPPIADESARALESAYESAYDNSSSGFEVNFTEKEEQDLRVREENLRKREADLLAKTRLLEKREATVSSGGNNAPNWPFTKYPILYHSIANEIPEANQPLAKKFYATVLLTWGVLFFNWITWLSIWGASAVDKSGSQSLWATIYFGTGVIGSWKLWYMPVYKALKGDSTILWCFFFLCFAAHCGFCIFMTLGIPGVAGAGIIVMIDVFGKGFVGTGLMCLSACIIWALVTASSLWLLKQAHNLWRGRGGAEKLQKNVDAGVAAAKIAGAAAQASDAASQA